MDVIVALCNSVLAFNSGGYSIVLHRNGAALIGCPYMCGPDFCMGNVEFIEVKMQQGANASSDAHHSHLFGAMHNFCNTFHRI